jgi:Ca-activated chloride channel family protein
MGLFSREGLSREQEYRAEFKGYADSDIDEIWVIVRPEGHLPTDDASPRSGAMLACFPDGRESIPFPLMHTEVHASVSGYIASVEVVQQFHNPFLEKIEAEYVFPLPQNAAVNEFVMKIGSRNIRGIIRERQEAERIYQQAKRQGYTASLLTQERPNIFTQKVANIESRQSVHVQISYMNTLAYVNGWYEFVFPMVVGPRFNPPYQSDGIGAAALGRRGASGQSTEIPYLAPDQRSGHAIAMSVTINAGTKIEQIECRSHDILKTMAAPGNAVITLNPKDSVPNKDFVLRYKAAGESIKSAFLADSDRQGNYFTLMLYPPEQLSELDRTPMEMIFVLDCSGSMQGEPIRKAKAAVRRALNRLRPEDTFQIIRFSNSASALGYYPIPATRDNVRRGLRYADSLESSGGTMMIEGIKAALDYPHDARRLRIVSFMTDGFIGNESEILAAIRPRLGRARIFSFGVGSSVNRYLLDRMAKIGHGAVAYIGLNDNPERAVDAFYETIFHPALTDISIDWGNLQVTDVYPSSMPDLFVGRPVILTGRFAGHLPLNIQLTGRVGDSYRHLTVPVTDDAIPSTHRGISFVWARKKIEDLALRSLYENDPSLAYEIKKIALDYGIMSAYTAFVAVDSTHRTEGDYGINVQVPVPVPAGVRYDTTVSDEAPRELY